MKYIMLISIFLLFAQCEENDPVRNSSGPNSGLSSGDGDWLIPQNQVFDGGPGIDGIPSVDNPQFASIGDGALNYLSDDDKVLVYESDGEMKAYTHPVLDWHEIVNDEIGEDKVAVTYCPLTGTGIGWGREINGATTTFGVSGLLYETNLMPYDRATNSYWNQMFNKCVHGELIGEVPEFFNLIEMNYGALKQMYPDAKVITTNTGFSRQYSVYPYGSYKTNSNTLFPISNEDDRLQPKEIVRAIIFEEVARAYTFPESGRKLVTEVVGGQEMVIVADQTSDMIVSFETRSPDISEALEFTLNTDTSSRIIMTDQLGNEWDALGRAVSGPNEGAQLEIPYSYMGYWFSFATFFPNITIHGN